MPIRHLDIMASSSTPLVSTKECDYLDEDKPIRGQNYVCLSFLSPEDVLANKDVFVFNKYLEFFSKEVRTLLDGFATQFPEHANVVEKLKDNNRHLFDEKELQDHFRFYQTSHSEELEKEFHEKNDFRTTMRGIKVRGVFDTLKEAQVRAEILKKMGDTFDIYIGQVGCWCPWSPNPEDLENQEYAEAKLNTLMKQYKENMTLRDAAFQTRKDELIQSAKNQAATASQVADSLTQPDPWSSYEDRM